MKSVILCEGKTDAILISYYLGRTKNWLHLKNPKKAGLTSLPIRNEENEFADWYTCDGRYLAIWGVGSKDNFEYAIGKILEYNISARGDSTFQKIVVITDRDQLDADQQKLEELCRHFARLGVNVQIQNRRWVTSPYHDGFGNEMNLDILALVIPFDKKGALETFLLDALSRKDEEDRKVVEASIEFISSLNSQKYLLAERMRVKAELAATLAVMYPDKVFTPINNLLQEIPWEKYPDIQEGFREIEEI